MSQLYMYFMLAKLLTASPKLLNITNSCIIKKILLTVKRERTNKIRSTVMLLITGVIISYITGSLISLLQFWASHDGLQAYVLWGMGNFSSVSTERPPKLSILSIRYSLLMTRISSLSRSRECFLYLMPDSSKNRVIISLLPLMKRFFFILGLYP